MKWKKKKTYSKQTKQSAKTKAKAKIFLHSLQWEERKKRINEYQTFVWLHVAAPFFCFSTFDAYTCAYS